MVTLKHDPFRITGRTAISVSGGRTSGYMLWRVLQAHGGTLPADTVPLFANTGKENEATLVFVREMARQWDVPITWVEYRAEPPWFAVVDFDTAARDGEPFEALIRKRRYLPNPLARFCTSELKIRSMHRHLRAMGWYEGDDGWDQMIGIRADEQRRVAKIRARGHSTETIKEEMTLPLADASVVLADVRDFWAAQPFDLDLPVLNGRTPDGNCDLCFLKPPAVRLSILRRAPEKAVWWIAQEAWGRSIQNDPASRGVRFTKDGYTYAALAAFARDQRDMFDPDEEAIACFCGD